MINESGGINGRKIRSVSYAEKSDQGAALSMTRDLVEQTSVMMFRTSERQAFFQSQNLPQ